MTFNKNAFLDWLDEKKKPPSSGELQDEWPDFPFHKLDGCTGPIIEGKPCFYVRDLRKIAKGKRILD